MVQSICYAFIFLFEILTCAFFLENSYHRRPKKRFVIIGYMLAFAIQYGTSFLSEYLINLASFIICFLLLTTIFYETKISTSLFTTIMLSFFMLISELFVVFSSTYIFKFNLNEHKDNLLAFVIQSSLSKLLFLLIVFFAVKLFKKRESKEKANKFSILLCISPITSVVIFLIMYFWGAKVEYSSAFHIALSTCAILMLFSNLFIFYIHEKMQETNIEITQLQLEKQHIETISEYYDFMSDEIEKHRILKHDLKNHNNHILSLLEESNIQEVKNYIKSLSEDFGLDVKIKYSGNKIIDVILNRYKKKCEQNGIDLVVEQCGSNLEFMSDSDIVALLDNLFDNAFEAAIKSTEKKIHFAMHRHAMGYTVSDYIVISLTNSCDVEPISFKDKLLSIKKDTGSHGYGTKSIKRIVDKYDGNFVWKYLDETREFKASAILKII